MAELDEIRLLLRQQSDAFQAQMVAMQADLQETKGLIQVGRYGGGVETLSPIPCSVRLDMPKLLGTDPDHWIFSITEYFTLLSTLMDQQLHVVGFNLEGDAAEWFQWMTRNKLITTWDGFLESVQNRFGPWLIQVGRYGGGGETLSPIPCSVRLDMPKLLGTDPDHWIFSITEYFTLLSTLMDQQLHVVGFNLEGDAAEWFQWMTRNKLITTWDGFLESVQNRFGP
nr:prolyl oligopeptidase family protein [Tanacetum cinerariifolium]